MDMIKIIHPFEKAKMGVSPFRFLFCYSLPSPTLAEQNPEAYNMALKEMPRDVGCGSCQCCGTPIIHNFIVESADGIKSAVGCECVRKTGDKTLITKVESERRAIEKKQRAARDRAARDEWLKQVDADGVTNREKAEAHAAAIQAERDARIAKQRADQKARDEEAAEAIRSSHHVGQVGERIELELIYSHTASFPGAFGTFFIQTFRTQDGATVVYKGGSPIGFDDNRMMEKGVHITVKATVKKHDAYNEVKQTVISRAKVLERAT